jgi:hypothetical protein
MGIHAEKGLDPFDYGLQRIEHFKNIEGSSDDESSSLANSFIESNIQTPDSDLLCDKRDIECLEVIIEKRDEIQQVLSDNQELLNRYRYFKNIKSYKTLSTPSISVTLPEYQALAIAHKLFHLRSIQLAFEKKQNESVNILLNNIESLRKFFPIADDLILKMVITAFIAQDMELISQLYSKNMYHKNLVIHNMAPLRDLDEHERSLELVMKREFSFADNMMRTLENNQNDILEIGAWVPKWMVRTVFKPNATLNSMFPNYKFIANASTLETKEVALVSFEKEQDSLNLSFKNSVGHVLANTATPNFEGYIGRLHDLQCKSRLLKIKMQDPENFESNALTLQINSVNSNPYDGSIPYKDEETNQICFHSPLDDDKRTRCTAI